MDIRALVGLLVVLAIVSAGVGYFSESAPETSEPQNGDALPETPEEPQGPETTGTLEELMRSGSYRCTIGAPTEIASTGTIYIALGKLRGDFATRVIGGASIKSHLIAADGYVYTWSDFSQNGVRTKLDMSGRIPDALLSGSVHYYCAPWEADVNVFVLPPGISFSS